MEEIAIKIASDSTVSHETFFFSLLIFIHQLLEVKEQPQKSRGKYEDSIASRFSEEAE